VRVETSAVRFTRTVDGVSIAYTETGQGAPLVFIPIGMTHLQYVRRYDRRLTAWLEQLGQRFRLVQYDSRGQGMSARGLSPDHTVADLQLDLEAVVDELNLEPVILVGYFYSAHVAIRYAVQHPERVRALILVSCSVSMTAWPLDSMMLMAGQNWEGFLHTWVPASFSPEERDDLVKYFKLARTPEDWVISARVWWISDVSEELPLVRTPALVLHPRDFIWLRPAESMKVASSIAGARFVSLDGILPLGDATEAMTAIDAFVSDLPALETPQATGRQGVHRLDSRLSVRENQVLRLIGEGKSNKEIAAELTLSVRTVERHVSSVYAKTGIHGRVAAATLALARTPS
jgi:pimeloyl-ACP methyl ester carboxylesterase/DNA-binding CsgD family transcriptional regulator